LNSIADVLAHEDQTEREADFKQTYALIFGKALEQEHSKELKT
jgi:hypothetical protein